jgi:tRNA(Ile)-lysidine synthase
VPLRSAEFFESGTQEIRKGKGGMSPRPLIQRIQEGLNWVSPRKKLIVAVSGGADSVAMLHLLLDAGYRKLVVAHFNHRLRGMASAGDVVFVGKLATKLNLPFEGASEDVRKRSKNRKLSLETAARDARYEFLAAVAKKHRNRSIVLAHHADDQVETCLFNFLRGSGISGLSGMKPHIERTIEGVRIQLHRPLLETTKRELLDYLKERKLPYREDATNAVAEASRNKLRLKVIPLIEEGFGSSFKASIVRNARMLADEEDFLALISLPIAASDSLPVKLLRELHPALRRRVLHGWLRNQRVEEPGFTEVERVASLLETNGPAKVNLPGNRHARRRSGVLFIE